MSTPRAESAPPRRRSLRRLLKVGTSLFGAAMLGSLGWLLVRASFQFGAIDPPKGSDAAYVFHSFAASLARLSYDLPYAVRSTAAPPGVCIVYMDEMAAEQLGQNPKSWDRSLHTRLLRRLTKEDARAVFFDIVFSQPEPGVDGEFAQAIRENGRAFIGGALDITHDFSSGSGARQVRAMPPTPALRAAAAGWGLLAFLPVDPDYGVRRIYAGTDTMPTATWRLARHLGTPLEDTPESRAQPRWLNYYGPPRSFPSVRYDRALADGDLPVGFFKDQIVIIGARSALSELTLAKDEFRNPYSLLGMEFTDGVEVHLTTLLNLMRGEFLRRLDGRTELWLAIALGVLLGGALPLFRPHLATAATLLVIAVLIGCALWGVQERLTWFAWCIPAFVQAPLALGWAVGTRYFIEERRRNALRDAFGHYLSPQVADRIADADFDLSPGGTVVEATLLMTDLEGFTPLAEQLSDPALVSRVLTDYFSLTTSHILENHGTIINFVGDAVFAVWGAPLPDAAQARNAALAAWRLHEASRIEVRGRVLRTRIGLHTGRVLAGNIGSAERFDYSVIGDAVNFASRLEGLNKFLGTDILLSDALLAKLGGEFLTRRLGEFRVVGKHDTHIVHELLGPAEGIPRPAWLDTFARGLDAFARGSLHEAHTAMRDTIAQRGGKDGPAEFYREEIATLRAKGLPPGWTGVVEFAAK